MALNLIKKIFNSKKSVEDIEREQVNTDCFYIPRTDTLKAVSERRPLTEDQISDYMKYILNNYYLNSASGDKLMEFTQEWVRYKNYIHDIQFRKDKAYKSLLKALKEGNGINKVDALWLSDKIFINDTQIELKRIITKEILDDMLDMKVESNRYNPMVGYQVDDLRSQLSQAKIQKQLDNNQ